MYVFLKNQTTERARSLGSVQCQGSQVLISVLKTLVPSDYQVSTSGILDSTMDSNS